jgi:pyrroline-5-carboxylate reductase
MKRVLAMALILGVASFGLSGCGEETKVKEEVSTPGGTTTTTESVKSTGDNPPANAAGQTGATGTPPK